MCFNETASLAAFSIGVISTIVLIRMKLYNFSLFYSTIILMQLVEYYAHKSLLTNNINMNKIASYFAYLLLMIQPLILSYVSYSNINRKSQNTLILLCISFIVFGLFSFYQNHTSSKFRISYIDNVCKTSFCRLNWEYFNIKLFHNHIFLLFYFGIISYVGYNSNLNKNNFLIISMLILGITLLYMMTENKEINVLNSSFFGSLWCFLCVILGPLVIMNKNLAL